MSSEPRTPTTAGRRRQILEAAQHQGHVTVAELSRLVGASEVTIRRDLEYLERAGLLHRFHGGARATAGPGQLSPFEARLLQNVEIKQAIGAAAAAEVRPGDTVFLDSGTTVLEIARKLPVSLLETGGLTIITRSLAIAAEIRLWRRTRLMVVGGVYVHDFDDFVGTQVEAVLRELHADLLFVGTDGVTLESGLTTDNVMEANLYRAMVRCASRTVVAADSSKIGVTKVQATLSLDDIQGFITDSAAPPDFVAALRDRGCQVEVVASPHPRL